MIFFIKVRKITTHKTQQTYYYFVPFNGTYNKFKICKS